MDPLNFHPTLLASATTSHARRRAPTVIAAATGIQRLRIGTWSLAGGYRIAPTGGLNWYFTNLGLIATVQCVGAQELDFHVRRYLDLYNLTLKLISNKFVEYYFLCICHS